MTQPPPNLDDLTAKEMVELIHELIKRLNVLEAKLERDSHNSSQPPSKDDFKRKPKSLRQTGKARPGGQQGHAGKTLMRVARPDATVIHPVPARCDACGARLDGNNHQILREARQVFDLPALRFAVTEHRVQAVVCRCGKAHTGQFPSDVNQAVQYGPRVKAATVYLTQYQQLPVDRTAQALHDLFGLAVSTGSIQNNIREAAQALTPARQAISQALLAEPVVHFDETSMPVGRRKPCWLHSASTATLTWYGAHPRRGKAALDDLAILPAVTGVAMHDGWQPYADYPCAHALCNAHHLRELIFVVESTRQSWAQQMIDLLLQAKQEVAASVAVGKSSLAPRRMAHYLQCSHDLIHEGLALNPRQTRAMSNQSRGRIKQSFAHNLLARLQRYPKEVWRFLADHRVPFDNNQAERDIRMPKLKPKISGGWRTEAGLEAYCIIRSYLSSLRKQKRSLIDALTLTFCGYALSPLGG